MARSMTAQEMYDFFAHQFETARNPVCKTCKVPRTFWGPAAGPNAAGYWYMELPQKCDKGCRDVLTRVWAQLTTDYMIAPPPRDVVITRPVHAR